MASPKSETTADTTEGVKDSFQFEPVSVDAATETLKSNRTGRASGRRSQYKPVVDAVGALKDGEVIRVQGIGKMQLQGLRNQVFKAFSKETYTVKSVREKDADTFLCVIGRKVDLAK